MYSLFDPQQAGKVFRAIGCDHCMQTGYHGRSGIYELIPVDEKLRTMIHEAVSELEMLAYARTISPSMADDGYQKVRDGVTTLEEVLRVTQD